MISDLPLCVQIGRANALAKGERASYIKKIRAVGASRCHRLGLLFRPTGFAMRLEAVILPDLGTGPDVPIVVSHWFAVRGDEVWEGDRLVEVLVGPATFDVAAPISGRLAAIHGREDDWVSPGAVLGFVAVTEDGPSAAESGPTDLRRS